jgi:hypothetical protein
MDFSEFETARGGIWRICAVIDYATKYCLAATVTPTSRGQDALGCLCRAVVEAERVLDLDDLRADRGVMDVVDADDYVIGEAPAPIAVVTDNVPCFRGVTFADAFAGIVGTNSATRLNRGGDREANHALWRIVLVRMRWDPPTRAYVARTAEGLSKPEIMRCLKRATRLAAFTAP